MTLTPAVVALLVGFAVSCFTDLRDGKIPNWLTASMIAVGLAIGLAEGTALASVLGLAAGFAVHFPLWLLGVEKGGDAKLVMAVGALLGWAFMVETTLWYAVLYLPVGLILLAVQGRLTNLLSAGLWTVAKAQGGEVGERPAGTKLKTAPIIAAAGVVALLTAWLDFTA